MAENEYTKDQLAVKLWHSKLSSNKIERKKVPLPSSYSEHPLLVTLDLLTDIEAPVSSKCKSKKFNRGNQ